MDTVREILNKHKRYNVDLELDLLRHFDKLRNEILASQQCNAGNIQIQCPRCGLREPMYHKCDNCSHEFNA